MSGQPWVVSTTKENETDSRCTFCDGSRGGRRGRAIILAALCSKPYKFPRLLLYRVSRINGASPGSRPKRAIVADAIENRYRRHICDEEVLTWIKRASNITPARQHRIGARMRAQRSRGSAARDVGYRNEDRRAAHGRRHPADPAGMSEADSLSPRIAGDMKLPPPSKASMAASRSVARARLRTTPSAPAAITD